MVSKLGAISLRNSNLSRNVLLSRSMYQTCKSNSQMGIVHRDLFGCVRLASLGRPWSAPVRSNSFDGAHPGQPPVPCLWSGSLGVDLRCMPSPREGECDLSISSCQGLTRVSIAGSTQGSLSNAPYVS